MDEQEDTETITEEEDLETTDVSGPEEEAEPEEEPSKRRQWLKSALLVLRDIGIALLVVLVVFLVLWAYSGVWPPIVVVESSSMQHEDFSSSVGVIDTGDLVLVQNTNSPSEIETWANGRCSGHETYGKPGDVIIYNQLGGGDKPIIHRALIWLEFNSTTNNSFDIPDLDCEEWVYGSNWWVSGFEQNATPPYNLDTTIILNITWDHGEQHIYLYLNSYLDDIKADAGWTDGGFLALGDNNNNVDANLIKHGWIIGRARGELPWFGLIKLTVTGEIPWGNTCSTEGQRNCAPSDSWNSLIIALIVLIVVPIVLDISLGFYQRWKSRRPQKEEDVEEPEEEVEPKEELKEEELEEESSEEETEEIVESS